MPKPREYMSNPNCLKIEGYVFNIQWDIIPEYILFVKVRLPYALSYKEGELAVNPQSGRTLAWRFEGEEWSSWNMDNSIPVTIVGPEDDYSWEVEFDSFHPDKCSVKYFVRYGDSYLPLEDEEKQENWLGLKMTLKLDLTTATNVRVMYPEESWRS